MVCVRVLCEGACACDGMCVCIWCTYGVCACVVLSVVMMSWCGSHATSSCPSMLPVAGSQAPEWKTVSPLVAMVSSTQALRAGYPEGNLWPAKLTSSTSTFMLPLSAVPVRLRLTSRVWFSSISSERAMVLSNCASVAERSKESTLFRNMRNMWVFPPTK